MSGIIPYRQVLVVEDESGVGSLIKSTLEKNHFEVHVFDDPVLSLTIFRDDPVGYFLVIYDTSIKQMSAFEFLRQVKEENPDVRIVLITTIKIKPTEFSKVLPSLNVDGFLQKRYISSQIIPCINKILGPRRIGRSDVGMYR